MSFNAFIFVLFCLLLTHQGVKDQNTAHRVSVDTAFLSPPAVRCCICYLFHHFVAAKIWNPYCLQKNCNFHIWKPKEKTIPGDLNAQSVLSFSNFEQQVFMTYL